MTSTSALRRAFVAATCAVTCALGGAALLACGSQPKAITPTLPGDGDANVAAPSATSGKPGSDPWAGRTDLITAPPAAPPAPMDLPPFQRFTLPSGLAVVIVPSNKLPVVSLQLAIKVGRADEPKVKVGVAEYTAEMLLKGSRGKDALAVARAIDKVGGQLSSDASHEATVVSCNVLARDIGTCLALVPAAVMAPTFPAGKMNEVRDGMIAVTRRRLDDAGQMAGVQVQNLLWGDQHPRGWATSADGIAAITRDDLVAWHRAYFSPDNALLVVTGDVDAGKLRKDLTRAFAGWKKSKVAPRPSYAEPRLSGVKVRLVDKPRQSQTHIRIAQLGIRHDDPRFFESLVWNYSLGGGAFSSRLMKALRVDGGKAYGASSTFDRNLDRGAFVAGTFTRNAEAVAAAELLIAEIAKMEKSGPTEAEVADAIANIAGSYALRFETASDVASSILAAELHGFGEEYLENYAVRVGKVDVASARQAAKEILDPASFVIVLVGDAKDLEPQLKAKGWRYEKVSYAAPIGGSADLPPPPPPADPKAEAAGRKLLDEALAAKGGAARLAAVKSFTLAAKGTLVAQGQSVDVEVTRSISVPDRMRIDLLLNAGKVKISYAFDGAGGWQHTPAGVGDIPADQVPALIRQRWLDPELILLRYRDKGAVVRALADETVEGVLYKLVNVTSADRRHTATFYIDAKTKLVSRLAYPEQGGVTIDTFDDYRAISGIQVAHKRTSRNLAADAKAEGEAANLVVTKVEINPKLAASVFERPAAGSKP
jgi:zinc protease